MEKLIRGIHEFQANVFGTQKELFERLAAGQQPETLFITCSDSRIDPSLLTQTNPGELFILRNAGNIVPPFGAVQSAEAATVEFAITALGIRDIIICGHTHCGAMKGLLAIDQLDAMPSVKAWLAYAEATRQIMREKYTEESGEQLVIDAIKENVLVQLENLRTHPTVAAGVSSGRIKLHGWVYKLETGDVFAYDFQSQRFASIRSTATTRLAGGLKDIDMI
jgi:carbonic anhydrase